MKMNARRTGGAPPTASGALAAKARLSGAMPSSQGRAIETPRPRSTVRRETRLFMGGLPSAARAERLVQDNGLDEGRERVAVGAGAPGDLPNRGSVEGLDAAPDRVGERL